MPNRLDKTKKELSHVKKRILSLALALSLVLALVPSTVTANTPGFSDLSENHWAYPVIMNLARTGVISGFTDGTYLPESAVTRDQFATLVVKLLEPEPTETEAIFNDVPVGSWSNAWVTAAVRRGIIIPSEYGEQLGATEPITREEAAVWMVRGLGVDIGAGVPNFADSDSITYKAEIAAAFEMGLVAGMPGNRFAPLESATRAQAAALVTNMSKILAEITPGEVEEVFNYEYRNDVKVIANPPAYSFTEANGTFTAIIPAATDEIRGVSAGNTFVLEPTAQNPDGLAGRVTNIVSEGTGVVITASVPQSIEEIYEEFEFVGNIDLLGDDVDFEITPAEWDDNSPSIFVMASLGGVPTQHASAGFRPTVRTTSTEVIVSANNSTYGRINIEKCELAWRLPKIHANINIKNKRADLYVTTSARIDFTASSSIAVDTVIPLTKITVKPVVGVHIDIPVGIRITANGEYRLETWCSMGIDFGIINGSSSAPVTFNYGFEFNHHTRATASLNIQARARLGLAGLIHAYGIEGDFGRGLLTNNALQARCPSQSCFVVESFQVRNIKSLTTWGELRNVSALRFNQDLARGLPSTLWYRTGGSWQKRCNHGGAAEQPGSSSPAVDTNERGNSVGNIANGGYAAIQGDRVYYCINNRIFSMHTDGTDRRSLDSGSARAGYLNVVGDRIYYSNFSDGGKIYTMRTDGTDRRKLNDDDSWDLNVVGDRIYYSNVSDGSKIYTMRTDGTDQRKLNDDASGNINVVGDRIYYSNVSDGDGGTYSIRTDGTDRRKLSDERFVAINVVGDWIFYSASSDSGGGFYSIRTDGTDRRFMGY
jgi:hypothetical protein